MAAPGAVPSARMCWGRGQPSVCAGGLRELCWAGFHSCLPGTHFLQLHLLQAVPHQQELGTRVQLWPSHLPLMLQEEQPWGLVGMPPALPMTRLSPEPGISSAVTMTWSLLAIP